MNKHWMVCWLELGTQQTTRSTQKQTLCSIVNPIELESCQKFWVFVDKLLIILSSLGENYCCSKFYCLILIKSIKWRWGWQSWKMRKSNYFWSWYLLLRHFMQHLFPEIFDQKPKHRDLPQVGLCVKISKVCKNFWSSRNKIANAVKALVIFLSHILTTSKHSETNLSTCFTKPLRWGSVWKYQKYAKTFDSQETRSQMLLKLELSFYHHTTWQHQNTLKRTIGIAERY